MRGRTSWAVPVTLALTTAGAALTIVPAPAIAGDEIVIAPAEVSRILFVAGDAARLDERPRDAVLERVLQQMYVERPGLAASEAVAEITGLRAAMGAGAASDATSENEELLTALVDATEGAPTGPTGSAVRSVVEDVLTEADDGGVGTLRLTPSIDALGTLGEGPLESSTVLTRSIELSSANTAFGQARDLLWESTAGQSVFDSVTERLDDPDLAATSAITQHLQGESLVISRAAATAAAVQQLSVAAGARAAALSAVDAVADKADAVKAAPPAEKDEAKAELDALKAQVKGQAETRGEVIAGAKNVVTLVLPIIEAFDPKLAGEIKTIASTVIGVAEKVNTLVGVIGSIGVNLASQNYFGLIKDAVGLFTGLQGLFGSEASAKPDPVKVALKELKEDLVAFRAEMNTRFDRVDKGLNQIYSTMVTRLGEIEAKIDGVSADVRAAFDELIRQQAAMERMEQRLYGALKDASDRDLHTAINTAIGWRDRSVDGAPMANGTFLQYAGLFHSWTQTSALDQVALVPDPRAYDDDSLVAEVAHPLDRNVDYLRQFGAQRFGLAPLGNDRVPNPRDWAVAARAYGQLLLENPEYMTSGLGTWLGQVEAQGRTISDALGRIGRADASTGTGSAVLNGALGLYRSRWDELDGRVRAIESSYLDDLGVDVDLWGGSNQAPPSSESIATNCLGLTLGAGGTYAERVPRSASLAKLMGLGSTKACSDAEWVNERQRMITPPSGWTYTTYYGRLRSSHTWVFDSASGTDRALASGTHTTAERTICQETYDNEGGLVDSSCQDPSADPVVEMRSAWSGIKDAITWSDNAAGRAALGTDVDAWLVDKQKKLYQQVHTALTTPSSSLAASARRLTAAKALVGMYVHAGMPRAVEVDDELRGLLEGQDRLLDEDAEGRLRALWSAAVTSPPARNLATILDEAAGQRVSALEARLGAHVGSSTTTASTHAAGTKSVAASGSGLGSEPSLLVATTLDRLRLVRFVLTGPRPPAPTPSPQPSPAPAPAPTSAPSPTAAPTTAPEPLPEAAVRIRKVRKATVARLLARKLAVPVESSLAGKVVVTIKKGKATIARGTARARAGAKVSVRPKVRSKAKRLLRRTPVKVTITVAAPGGAKAVTRIRLR